MHAFVSYLKIVSLYQRERERKTDGETKSEKLRIYISSLFLALSKSAPHHLPFSNTHSFQCTHLQVLILVEQEKQKLKISNTHTLIFINKLIRMYN